MKPLHQRHYKSPCTSKGIALYETLQGGLGLHEDQEHPGFLTVGNGAPNSSLYIQDGAKTGAPQGERYFFC